MLHTLDAESGIKIVTGAQKSETHCGVAHDGVAAKNHVIGRHTAVHGGKDHVKGAVGRLEPRVGRAGTCCERKGRQHKFHNRSMHNLYLICYGMRVIGLFICANIRI